MGAEGEGFGGDGGRGECSLCVLTNQFLKYVSDNGQKAVDLKHTAEELQTRKRRIYDVTNVLEGVGLLQKTSQHKVQWVNPDPGSSLGTTRFKAIHRDRMARLDDLSLRMQEAIGGLTECIEQLTASSENTKLLYVKKSDVVQVDELQGQQVLAIKAPPGSTLTIPDPHRGTACETDPSPKFKAVVKSRTGPLAIWMVATNEEQATFRQDTEQSDTTHVAQVTPHVSSTGDVWQSSLPAPKPPVPMGQEVEGVQCRGRGCPVLESPVLQFQEAFVPTTPYPGDRDSNPPNTHSKVTQQMPSGVNVLAA